MTVLTKNKPELKFNKKTQSVVHLWEFYSAAYSDIKVVKDKYNGIELTYEEFFEQIKLFSKGLQALGLKQGEHVSLFSENSSKWLLADQAVLFTGAVDAVRGSEAPAEELEYILAHSDSVALIAENLSVILKLKDALENACLKFIVCLSDEEIPEEIKNKFNVYKLNDVLNLGKSFSSNDIEIKKDDLATLIYTSGTTGKPKGVMLTHGNFLSQVKSLQSRLNIKKDSKTLAVLPTWHSYERTAEYFVISRGCSLIYTNLLNLKDDIKREKPDVFISVPRIWEAFYNGVQAELKKHPLKKQKFIQNCFKLSEKYIQNKRIAENKDIFSINSSQALRLTAAFKALVLYPLHKFIDNVVYKKVRFAFGGNLICGITGGGAISRHLDDFYEIIGINVVNGYGLTETSPILAVNSLGENLRGSVGSSISGTELKITDGVVMAKGPQVMKGYYKDTEETAKILSQDGWINTGDLGWLTKNGELVLTGRAKDIIVLSNGENIEPHPIEEACLSSPFIDQIMLVGQDKAALGALVIPNEESIKNWAKFNGIKYHDSSEITNKPEIQKLFKQELLERVKSRSNFRPFERIQYFKLLNEPFSVDNGLMTRTMKLRKNEIQRRYSFLIEEMFQ